MLLIKIVLKIWKNQNVLYLKYQCSIVTYKLQVKNIGQLSRERIFLTH